jgi:hypothetical protein
MDGITSSIIGSSVIDRAGMALRNSQAQKRLENGDRKVEHATFSIPQ